MKEVILDNLGLKHVKFETFGSNHKSRMSNKSSISTLLSIDETNNLNTKLLYKSNSMKALEKTLISLSNTNFSSLIPKTVKQKNKEIKKENKQIQETLNLINNKIKVLSTIKSEIKSKENLQENQNIKKQQIKVKRLENKSILVKSKSLKSLELANQSCKIKEMKDHRQHIPNKVNNLKERKQKEYSIMRNDSKIISTLTKDIKEHYNQINSFKSLKVKENILLSREKSKKRTEANIKQINNEILTENSMLLSTRSNLKKQLNKLEQESLKIQNQVNKFNISHKLRKYFYISKSSSGSSS